MKKVWITPHVVKKFKFSIWINSVKNCLYTNKKLFGFKPDSYCTKLLFFESFQTSLM